MDRGTSRTMRVQLRTRRPREVFRLGFFGALGRFSVCLGSRSFGIRISGLRVVFEIV